MRKNYRKSFYSVVIKLIPQIKEKSQEFDNFQTILNIDNSKNYRFEEKSIALINTLLSFEFVDIFNSYTSGIENSFNKKETRRNAIIVSYDNIYLLKNLENKYLQHISDFNNEISKYQDRRNISVKEFSNLSDGILHNYYYNKDYKFSPNEIDYYEKLNKIHTDAQQTGETAKQFVGFHENICEPILSLNKKFQEIPNILLLNDCLLSVKINYDSINNVLSLYKDIFKSYNRKYCEAAKELEDCKKKLN